jgi:hypothetical protein
MFGIIFTMKMVENTKLYLKILEILSVFSGIFCGKERLLASYL